MDNSQIKHELAMLYLKTHDISKLSPNDLSWFYDQVKSEMSRADAQVVENRGKFSYRP